MSYFSVLKGLFNNTPKEIKVDDQGSIFTTPQSITSSFNNTTTPLLTGEAWSGSAEQNTYRDVMVVCKTDAPGTLYLDFSPDGTNWDSTLTYTLAANIPEFHVAEKGPRYYRTRVSSSGDQSYIRLYTYYGDFRQGNLPLNLNISSDADAIVTRAVQLGEDPLGAYNNNKVDGYAFITTSSLASGSVYTSSIIGLSPGFSQVQTQILADQDGTIKVYWYSDSAGNNQIRVLTIPYISGSGFQIFGAPAFAPYVKYTYENGSQAQGNFYFDTKFTTKAINGQVSVLTSPIVGSMAANLGRNIIMGQTDGGQYFNVPVTAEGHLEVALHAPRLPFGSIHTEKLNYIFQSDAVYNILNTNQISYGSSLSGTAQISQSMFTVSTGTTQYSEAFIQSRKRLKYRPGQGIICMFTALFDTPAKSSYQVAGLGSSEDGILLGYSGSSFGLLYSSYGKREQQLLNVASGSLSDGTTIVTLAGVTSSVTVTNNNNVFRTAYEISQGTFAGWEAQPTGSAVLFTANSAGNKTGIFSISGSDATGSFTEIQAGVVSTEVFISQSSWNGDKLDGTGPSGVTLDKTKGNIFRLNIQYLGFGPTYLEMEINPNGNNPDFVILHSIDYPNNYDKPVYSNPSFPFTMAVYSAGSMDDLTLRCGSFCGAIEGDQTQTGNSYTYTSPVTSVSTTLYTSLYTILNSARYGGKVNQGVVLLEDLNYSTRLSANGYGNIYLIKNGTLTGTPVFNPFSTTSCTLIDTGSTSVSFLDNNQVVYSVPISETSNGNLDIGKFGIDLQPGEWITVAAKLGSGTSAFTDVSINTREDI